MIGKKPGPGVETAFPKKIMPHQIARAQSIQPETIASRMAAEANEQWKLVQ